MSANPKRCPKCLVGGYRLDGTAVSGKPQFRCDRCGYTWTNGKTGGGYVGLPEFGLRTREDRSQPRKGGPR